MTVEVGRPAPDFALRDQHGQTVRLSDLRGSLGQRRTGVVLVFFPFSFSRICTGELCEIRDNISVFAADDVQVVAISCDAVHSQRAFAEEHGFDFPVLSDFWPHGAVAQDYGVFDAEAGRPLRGTFLVDDEGLVRWTMVNPPGEARPLAAYREALAAL
jgi:peroxiredoxin